MASRVLIAWILVVAAGCSKEAVDPPPAAPVDWVSLSVPQKVDAGAEILSAKERSLPDKYAAALASEGFAALGPLLDEEVHLMTPGLDDARGREMVLHSFDRLFGAFSNRKVTLGRIWRTPSEQTIEWSLAGVHQRGWMGVAATQQSVTIRGLTLLWTKDDGSIVDVHVYADLSVVRAQLGASPKELRSVVPAEMPASKVYEQTAGGSGGGVALVRACVDALESNDETAYLRGMADDLDVYTLDRSQPTHGKEAARVYFRSMRRAIGQLDTTVEGSWGVEPFAIVEYSISGEQLGPIGWVPARRDKVVRLQIVDVAEIRDAKIARIWRYDDLMQLQAGFLDNPEGPADLAQSPLSR